MVYWKHLFNKYGCIYEVIDFFFPYVGPESLGIHALVLTIPKNKGDSTKH